MFRNIFLVRDVRRFQSVVFIGLYMQTGLAIEASLRNAQRRSAARVIRENYVYNCINIFALSSFLNLFKFLKTFARIKGGLTMRTFAVMVH